MPVHMDESVSVAEAVSSRPNQSLEQYEWRGQMKGPFNGDLQVDIKATQAGFNSALANSSLVNASIEPELLSRFKRIGNYPMTSSAKSREAEYRFWRALGSEGSEWLIKRIDLPLSQLQLWGISNVLAAMGPSAIEQIISRLSATRNDLTAATLLSAIAGMSHEHLHDWADQIASVIRTFLTSRDDLLRTRAVEATAALPEEQASRLLIKALRSEVDPNVKETIQDVLDNRS